MSERLTDTAIREAMARAERATPGPWSAEHEVDLAGFEQHKLWIIMGGQPTAYGFDRAVDAELCAHARADVFDLGAEALARGEEVERLQSAAMPEDAEERIRRIIETTTRVDDCVRAILALRGAR